MENNFYITVEVVESRTVSAALTKCAIAKVGVKMEGLNGGDNRQSGHSSR